ncbi:hypothetical protein GJU40_15865 [Bacillus lacus]|uniref:Uncharacterized protein n=1 Tax=Metabacillus lacus TaxID=1983721 RepID=A0A7X2J1A3_9BACI|nr:hypothetical protein [Metabacillus lacus]MRX73621.1 hypothetical protein [Metabacillus lacus]
MKNNGRDPVLFALAAITTGAAAYYLTKGYFISKDEGTDNFISDQPGIYESELIDL